MAKRFTDTTKWKRQNYRELPLKMKVVMAYLFDNCDHAGVWIMDLGLMAYQVGAKVTEREIFHYLGEKLYQFDKDRIFIPSFIEFQYGHLSEDCNAHKPVIRDLRKYGLLDHYFKGTQAFQVPLANPSESLLKGSLTLQEEEKEKEIDQEEEKEMEKGKGGVGENQKPQFDFEALYQLYPKKGQGKIDGLHECKKQIKSPEDYALLKEAITRYRDYVTRAPQPGEFIPFPKHFSTFMRNSRWRECLDPGFAVKVGAPANWDYILADSEKAG